MHNKHLSLNFSLSKEVKGKGGGMGYMYVAFRTTVKNDDEILYCTP